MFLVYKKQREKQLFIPQSMYLTQLIRKRKFIANKRWAGNDDIAMNNEGESYEPQRNRS
jgi:hypothetical protein